MYEISRYNDVNILGTAHLLNFLANNKNSVKKLIIASSRSIYGEGKYKCEKHGVVYPNDRIASNMINGKFDLFCDVCGGELDLMPTDENSMIHPSSILQFRYSLFQFFNLFLLFFHPINQMSN